MFVQIKYSSPLDIRHVHIIIIVLVNIPIFVVIVYLLGKGCVKLYTFCRNQNYNFQEDPLDTFLSDDIREEKLDNYYSMNNLS